MMQVIADSFDAMRQAFLVWTLLTFGAASAVYSLLLSDQKARTRNERLRCARAEAAISFAAGLECGTEVGKFIQLYRAGFLGEIREQFPAFQSYMDARIAGAMGDQP